MRKPRSRWRERARAWKRRGHSPLRPWSGDSGALLVCGFVLEPLGRTTLSPRRVAARSPLGSEADQRVGGRANSIVQAQPPPRLPPLQARLRPGRAPHPGGRREVTGHAEQARGHVAGVRRLYGARHAVVPSARGRGSLGVAEAASYRRGAVADTGRRASGFARLVYGICACCDKAFHLSAYIALHYRTQ